jgi:hypothetical protein
MAPPDRIPASHIATVTGCAGPFAVVRHGILAGLTTAILLFGCNWAPSDRGAVTGGIVLDGVPIEDGLIVFLPSRGNRGPTAGASIAMGRYAIAAAKGPPVGWNRVEIRASRKSGKTIAKPFGQQGETIDEFVEAVADRYNSASELEAEIQRGMNTFDFQVQSQ